MSNNFLVSMALKAFLPQVKNMLGKKENKAKCYRFLTEQKDKIYLLEGETDIIAVVEAKQGNIILSVCTIDDNNTIVRHLYNYDFDEIVTLVQKIIDKSSNNGDTDTAD